ncbi:hypothetical protein AHAS_Ahas19G0223200 [Arachis hypogaea]
MVKEFYANLWVTYKNIKDVNPEFKTWCTMVRGKIVQFGPERVREMLQLPPSRDNPHSHSKRVNTDQILDQLEFIPCSIFPMSNRSEVTVDRAMMIHYIMLGNEVEVHRLIPQEIYSIAAKASTSARLAFPHLIFRLCEAARVCIDKDTLIPVDRPITRKVIEYARELGQASPQELVPPPQLEQPEIPQGSYLPPRDYWDQLAASIGKLASSIVQLRIEHKDHSFLLHQLVEEQQRQRRNLNELKRQREFPGGSNSHHD